MTNLDAVIWHLESMAFSMHAIDHFHPPADPFAMRMQYSTYIINLMSVLEQVAHSGTEGFYNRLDASLEPVGYPGQLMRDYLRELRNEILHRGLDPVSAGWVVDGIVRATSPEIWNRQRTIRYFPPRFLLRDVFHLCETHIKPVMEQHLQDAIQAAGTATYLSNPEDVIEEMLSTLRVAKLPTGLVDFVQEQLTPEMMTNFMTQASAAQIQKLRLLLKPYPLPTA